MMEDIRGRIILNIQINAVERSLLKEFSKAAIKSSMKGHKLMRKSI